MRVGRTTRVGRTIGALALLFFSLGNHCQGGGGSKTNAVVSLEPAVATLGFLEPIEIDVRIQTTASVQAYEVSVDFDPTMVVPQFFEPDVEFDDDGSFFVPPTLDLQNGRLTGLVDLRHGPSPATGSFRVARITFYSLFSPGSTSIDVSTVTVGTPTGSALVVTTGSSTITVSP